MHQSAALLFLQARTALHPGTGTALGTVDLPIQRERHTGWPTIAGSSLKGVVREHCRPEAAAPDYEKWLAVFGPTTDMADEHSGAVSFTDARILAFPVRSASGVFAWVTCAEVLQRLARDAALANGDVPPMLSAGPAEGTALVAPRSPLLMAQGGQSRLLLEEFEYVVESSSVPQTFTELAQWLAKHAVARDDDFTRQRLPSHLVVVSNNEFTYFVRHATEICARIGLDYQTKTVRSGALFYEEFLPAETFLYGLVLATDSRRKFSHGDAPDARRTVAMTAADVLAFVTQRAQARPVIQIGGSETIGKGICAMSLSS